MVFLMNDQMRNTIKRHWGTQEELGRAINRSQRAVSAAVLAGRWPGHWVIPMCKASPGLRPHDLRPDLYPDPEWALPGAAEDQDQGQAQEPVAV